MPICDMYELKGAKTVLHLEFSVVGSAAMEERVDKFNLLKREEGRKGGESRSEGGKVTDGDGDGDGERETVLKSPAPVQKLDSPRLDDGRADARLPGGEYTTES